MTSFSNSNVAATRPTTETVTFAADLARAGFVTVKFTANVMPAFSVMLLLQPWWLVVLRVSMPAVWSQMEGENPSTDSKHFAADEPSLVILTEYNPEGVCVPTSPRNTSFVCTDGSKGMLRPIVAIIVFSSLAMQFDCEICATLKPGAETLSGAPLPAALEAETANVCIPLVAKILIVGDSCFMEGL